MKDVIHHRKYMQKKIFQEIRKENNLEKPTIANNHQAYENNGDQSHRIPRILKTWIFLLYSTLVFVFLSVRSLFFLGKKKARLLT